MAWSQYSPLAQDPTAVTDDTIQTRKKPKPPGEVYEQYPEQPIQFDTPNAQMPADPEAYPGLVSGMTNPGPWAGGYGAGPTNTPAVAAPTTSAQSPLAQNFSQQEHDRDIMFQQMQNAQERSATAHPSLMRKILAGAAGVGEGFLTKNPMAGMATYKNITDAPKNQPWEDAAMNIRPELQRLGINEKISGERLQEMQRQAEGLQAGAAAQKAGTEANVANWTFAHPKVEYKETGDNKVPGGKKLVAVPENSGAIPDREIGDTITPPPQRGFETKSQNVQLKDGKTVAAFFDPNTKRYTEASSGQDITEQVGQVGNEGDTNLRAHMDVWARDFKGKNGRDPNDGERLQEENNYRTLPGRTSITLHNQLDNAPVDPAIVQGWVKKVQQDAKNWGMISDKATKNAVSNALGLSDTQINQLDAQTRDAAKVSVAALKHVGTIENLIANLEKKNQLGIMQSRWNDIMSGKIGSDPTITSNKDLQNTFIALKDNVGLLSTAMGRVHGGARGGSSPAMLEHIKQMINAGTMDPNTLRSALGVFKEWLQGYADMGGMGDQVAPGAGGGGNGGAPVVNLERGPDGKLRVKGSK